MIIVQVSIHFIMVVSICNININTGWIVDPSGCSVITSMEEIRDHEKICENGFVECKRSRT